MKAEVLVRSAARPSTWRRTGATAGITPHHHRPDSSIHHEIAPTARSAPRRGRDLAALIRRRERAGISPDPEGAASQRKWAPRDSLEDDASRTRRTTAVAPVAAALRTPSPRSGKSLDRPNSPSCGQPGQQPQRQFFRGQQVQELSRSEVAVGTATALERVLSHAPCPLRVSRTLADRHVGGGEVGTAPAAVISESASPLCSCSPDSGAPGPQTARRRRRREDPCS